MASEFYLVHHIFKPDMAKTWWEHPDGDLNEEEREKRTKRWFDAGFVNHCFMPMSKDVRCIAFGKSKMEFQPQTFRIF